MSGIETVLNLKREIDKKEHEEISNFLKINKNLTELDIYKVLNLKKEIDKKNTKKYQNF